MHFNTFCLVDGKPLVLQVKPRSLTNGCDSQVVRVGKGGGHAYENAEKIRQIGTMCPEKEQHKKRNRYLKAAFVKSRLTICIIVVQRS